MSRACHETTGGTVRRYPRFVASTRPPDGLPAAVEALFTAVDPAVACDRSGIDYGTLDDAERKLLSRAQRTAVSLGLKQISAAAADGDRASAKWLKRRGLTPRR
jgi:hypothetical protein